MMIEHLIGQAVEAFTKESEVSISLMQQRLRLGYGTAREVMKILESRGIVTLNCGSRYLTAARNIQSSNNLASKEAKHIKKAMDRLPVQTLIGHENKEGGLLLCGLNHGYSKEDERLDTAGIDRSDPYKSFFSDSEVNDYPFRNRIVAWFSLWGFQLARSKEKAGAFERSIVQTNWLQTCSNNMRSVNTRQACIDDCESFFQTCTALKPRVIFFFGRELFWAFSSAELNTGVELIFGARQGDVRWLQKDVFQDGKPRRRFRFGFQQYERTTVVVLPHATGSQGLADDYIESFKPEMTEVIESWWAEHTSRLNQSGD